MQVAFEMTPRDLAESIVAHRNSRTGFWVFVVIGLVMLGWGTATVIEADSRSQRLVNAVPPIAFAALSAWVLWVTPRLQARRLLRKSKWLQGSRTVLFDSIGAHWAWDGGSLETAWKNIIRYREIKSQFLLYTSPTSFNTLPKRVLSPEQIVEVRSHLAQNIQGPNRR